MKYNRMKITDNTTSISHNYFINISKSFGSCVKTINHD